MKPFQWTCPFCKHHQVAIDDTSHHQVSILRVGQTKHGHVGLEVSALRCVNPACNEIYVKAQMGPLRSNPNGIMQIATPIQSWNLRPDSSSVPQPDYIPRPIREDYYEACLIRDTSPKASATLARRCLQGMIRDFCGITKSRLVDEIKELKRQLDDGHAPKGVEPETIEAIDAVRGVGNIGAHMERDINQIVEVDPGEAQALIDLLEMLFEEWYVAREKRLERLAKVKQIAAEKEAALAEGRATSQDRGQK
ncbi:DUF4145 domain-containing protein [Rhizobium sp. RHZ01]|nr:DUF4145 domain-containing protein [Rhizobium sp. RHZ01]